MIDWLLSPVDPDRLHEVGAAISWHGRLMTLSWGVLVPLGILVARYTKVTPWQNWPEEVDNRFWWNGHRAAQYCGMGLALLGLWLIVTAAGSPSATSTAILHHLLGWAVMGLGLLQVGLGWLRGSKGGPTDRHLRGDHYDMTPRRLLFERLHKTGGYIALLAAIATLLTGLWQANAPVWMWFMLVGWWAVMLILAWIVGRVCRQVTTYQAIWGPDEVHPGNRMSERRPARRSPAPYRAR